MTRIAALIILVALGGCKDDGMGNAHAVCRSAHVETVVSFGRTGTYEWQVVKCDRWEVDGLGEPKNQAP